MPDSIADRFRVGSRDDPVAHRMGSTGCGARRRGHRSQTVDLARGDELSAEDYADEVRRQVPKTAAHPLVVAHSGAGLLLPAAARSLGAQRQVWLAASIPDGQRSLLEVVSAAPTDVNAEWLGKDPTNDPVLATYFLLHDCDLATLQ